jgi:hypothetical protein
VAEALAPGTEKEVLLALLLLLLLGGVHLGSGERRVVVGEAPGVDEPAAAAVLAEPARVV